MSAKYQVFLHPKAAKELDGLKPEIRERVESALKGLSVHPTKGIPLNPSRFRRIRVGNYRVIYETDDAKNKVIVLLIGHRKNVYDSFKRLF
jgi:mRNA interferase RelE/StbE